MSFKEWRAAMLEQGVLPVADLLNDCVFYPACGLDGDPVKYLHRQYQSFVYVDYAIERKQLLNHLNGLLGTTWSTAEKSSRASLCHKAGIRRR